MTKPPMTREEIDDMRAQVGEALGRVLLCKLGDMLRKLRSEHVRARARGRAERMIKEMRLLKSLLLAETPLRRGRRRRRPLTAHRPRTRSKA